MTTVRNTDNHRRVWPTRHFSDGRVLVLDPGEEGESEDAERGDPFLEVVAAKAVKIEKTYEDPTGGK